LDEAKVSIKIQYRGRPNYKYDIPKYGMMEQEVSSITTTLNQPTSELYIQ